MAKKTNTINYAGTHKQGMYKITITFYDGTREVWRHTHLNDYELSRAIDKCEIKSYKVELDTMLPSKYYSYEKSND